MKIDSAGNLYCCGPGGIHVFDPQAACLGVIRVPEYTANFCFGDDDRRSLYVTASSSVYRLRVATCLGVIKVPEYTANYCFGDNRRSLYVTASGSVYRVEVERGGVAPL